MPAPQAFAVRVPFYYDASQNVDDAPAELPTPSHDPAHLITYVTIEVLAFADRFFWLHVSESPALQHVPRLGSCSVSMSVRLPNSESTTETSVSTSQLMEFDAARVQDISAGTNTTVQCVFASSLSQKLVRGVEKKCQAQISVFANCAIEGDRCLSLLGTDGGSGFEMTYKFGALVYREALAVIAQHLEKLKDTA